MPDDTRSQREPDDPSTPADPTDSAPSESEPSSEQRRTGPRAPLGGHRRSRDEPAETGGGWRHRLHEIIFEADTPSGKFFDVLLLVAILLSVVAVLLESVNSIKLSYGPELRIVEWIFTILFTVEYVLRLIIVRRPLRYATSFFGIIDLLAILPTYLSLFVAGGQVGIVIRALRLLRVFRVLKLARYVGETAYLMAAVKASLAKITVFLGMVTVLVLILGSFMYFIEGEENGFTSIPRSIYWAIVTLTTVGYGDLTPQTVPGQTLASLVMLLGYAIIAVPTGIVTVELSHARRRGIGVTTRTCPGCTHEGHDYNAKFCKFCGEELLGPTTQPNGEHDL